jgi:hypothetical protein
MERRSLCAEYATKNCSVLMGDQRKLAQFAASDAFTGKVVARAECVRIGGTSFAFMENENLNACNAVLILSANMAT